MSTPLTTNEVAQQVGCSVWFIRKLAKTHRIGIKIGGTTGYRFTEGDVLRFREVLRPEPAVAARRKRRRAS